MVRRGETDLAAGAGGSLLSVPQRAGSRERGHAAVAPGAAGGARAPPPARARSRGRRRNPQVRGAAPGARTLPGRGGRRVPGEGGGRPSAARCGQDACAVRGGGRRIPALGAAGAGMSGGFAAPSRT